jgi:hypothetical protein
LKKTHNEEVHNLSSTPSIIGMIKSKNGVKRNAYRILLEKPEGKRPLARPSCRWVGSIKMDLSGIGCGDTKWIYLVPVGDQ